MVSIARASLLFEWRRYLAAILAISFAGLLVVVQLALLLGLFRTVSVVIDTSEAHLWIGFHNTQSVDLGRPINSNSDAAAWMHPQVKQVERYSTAYGDLRRADGVPISVMINAIDTRESALAFRKLLSESQREMLREPGAVLIDVSDVAKLGAQIGSDVEINGKRARIAGAVRGLRAIGGVNVVCSYTTARVIAPETAHQVTFYLVKLHADADPGRVAQEIADRGPLPRYGVWSADDFSVQSQIYWLLESGTGIGSGFASLLALIVGIAITSQTLAAAVMAAVREFAALRALGVSRRALRQVVIEQSLWVGLIGLALTAVVTWGIAGLGQWLNVEMQFPAWMLITVAVLMVLIAVISGLLALRPLLKAEPASLLR